MTVRWILAAGLVLGLGCGDGSTTSPSGDTSSQVTTETTPLAESCSGDALPRPFEAGGTGFAFGDVAGDFTVNELDGRVWTLSENWTGCDSYVFITYFEGGEGDALWASDVSSLLADAPRNVHFFFMSDEGGPARRESRVRAIADELSLGPARAERVHFVTDRATQVEGSVGAFMSDYLAYRPDSGVDLGDRGTALAPMPAFLGIDREQQWDSGGYTNDFVGGSPRIGMASYLPHFYDHKVELAHRLATEEATEVVLVDSTVTERVFVVEAELPSDLSAFDTVELDVSVFCPYRNVFACSEWDRIARIEVCTDGTDCEERRELVRWITPYWRRGGRRWAIDASPLKGLLTGGSMAFRIVMGPSWERATERHTRMALRLSSQAGAPARGIERVYVGGNFDDTYAESHPPVSFTPPADASRVELVLLLSGHGQAAVTNCAEWCDHRHAFEVNGTALPVVQSESGIGSTLGCAEKASEGVPPGQYGNWSPQRAYWCPGLPVTPIVLDITEHVTAGEANELAYAANYQGTAASGGGNIDLTAYVVWY